LIFDDDVIFVVQNVAHNVTGIVAAAHLALRVFDLKPKSRAIISKPSSLTNSH
jgi:hypothetical protein